MSTFTLQMGFPVIKVSSKMDGATRVLIVQQSKFNADGSPPDPTFQWIVPVTIGTETDPNKHSFVLESAEKEIRLEGVSAHECLSLNPDVKQLKLTPDRLGLHNDLYAQAKAGIISTTDLLETVQSMTHETLYTVWQTLAGSVSALHNLMSHTPHQNSYKRFGRDIFKGMASKIGWDQKDNENPLDTMLRPIVIGAMLLYEDEAYLAVAKEKFWNHMNGTETLSADLRSAVYCCQARMEGAKVLQTLINLMKSTDLEEEPVGIIPSLGSVREPELIKQVLELSMSNDIRSQDMDTCVAGCLATAKGKELAWEFVKQNWKAIKRLRLTLIVLTTW
ncbi:hypothetical protein LOD99_11922 [Oopsacas minuta]|uniref:ERAP1-like C-terminal domain-containing protein n=1 Tax=Oopsacas minuta TaxID=111878 RepID=A0AAV7JHE3_9METZ|nr:hypothetical protein LOD99_11922 [Oopsacas minuta]